MLPTTNEYGGWPNSGEIDIMEHVGHDMDVVHGSLHTNAYNFREGWHPKGTIKIPKVEEEFHTFILEWTPYQIDMYVDEYLYNTYKNDGQGPQSYPFVHNFYLLLNIAVGGAWGGQQGIDPIFPQEMVIDFVRIYDLADEYMDTQGPDQVENVAIKMEGPVANLSWTPSEDDYLTTVYRAEFKSGSDEPIVHESDNTRMLVLDLDPSRTYTLNLYALDEAGNLSEAYEEDVVTGEGTYGPVGEWITPDDLYFNETGKIVDKGDEKVLIGLEYESLIGYGFDVEEEGDYILDIETSARLFNGEVAVLNQEMTLLDTVVTLKTGADDVFDVTETTAFTMGEGKQVILVQTTEKSHEIRNVRLRKVND